MQWPSPKEIAEKHDLWAKKNLGQNFIFDLNLTRKIVANCGNIDGFEIIEIGPGPGGLTQAILEKPIKKLYAIELDERATRGLKELKLSLRAQQSNPDWITASPTAPRNDEVLNIIQADALNIDLRTIAAKPCAVIANLPYNIGTKLFTNWLEYYTHFEFFTLMFQREVAERLVAVPHTKDYGRLSVITQLLCEAEILFDVPPECFVPAPKVTSSIVKLVPRPKPLFDVNIKTLEKLLLMAFTQRRKMLRGSLKTLNLNFDELKIAPQARPEELSIEDFCKIANFISK